MSHIKITLVKCSVMEKQGVAPWNSCRVNLTVKNKTQNHKKNEPINEPFIFCKFFDIIFIVIKHIFR